jgi:DNA polymerase-1
MELRAAAEVYDDAAMRADFANGVDLHQRQAAETLNIPQNEVTPQQRNAAKPICFGTIYGAGPRGLAASAWANYGLVLTEDKAALDRQAFLSRYPDLAAGMDSSFVQSNQLGAISIGRFGRVIEASWENPQQTNGQYNYWRDLTDEEEEDEEEQQQQPLPWRRVLKRTLCCNAPIQGACADVAMLALTWADAALTKAGIAGGPILFVHDEIVLEVPTPDAERAAALLTDCMTRAFAAVFPNAPLNGLVEQKITDAWGSRADSGQVA